MIDRFKSKFYYLKRNAIIKTMFSGLDERYETIHLGNQQYGGFKVVPYFDKKKNLIIYSFGIGEDVSFSMDCLRKFDCDVYAFDPTPKSIQYVTNHEIIKNPRFHFFQYGLSEKDGVGKFHLPKNNDFVSGSLVSYDGVQEDFINVSMKSLNYIMDNLQHDYIDLIKMDIEGTEFPVIEALKINQMKFGQLCIEVHDRFYKDGLNRLKQMHYKLTQGGLYACISCVK